MKTVLVKGKNATYDVYIGRGSKWGNPYYVNYSKDATSIFDCKTKQEAIEKFREYILRWSNLKDELRELVGKRIWCPCNGYPCHGQVLVELVELMFGDTYKRR